MRVESTEQTRGHVRRDDFTERARTVLRIAQEEAVQLQHEYVGTEHILLALASASEGVAAAVLWKHRVAAADLRRRVVETVNRGKARRDVAVELPFTSRAKKVLDLATEEARALNHAYVGTEHLLLGLLREERGIAHQILGDAGVTYLGARAMVAAEAPAAGDVVVDRPRSVERTAEWAAAPPPTADPVRGAAEELLERCTARVRGIVSKAATTALTQSHREVDAEHLLLRLLQQDDGLAAVILGRLHVDRGMLLRLTVIALENPERVESRDEPIPFSAAALEAIRGALDESGGGEHSVVGTDHLLLGLLRGADGPVPRLLRDAGLSADLVRRERARILG